MVTAAVHARYRWLVGWVVVATTVVLARGAHPAWPVASPLSAAWAVALAVLFATLVVPSVRGP